MSDELNKYPGNLRHHKVDGDIDEDTALLISKLAAEVVRLRDARAKDAELIQRLVNALFDLYQYQNVEGAISTLEIFAANGYKPTIAE